MKPVRWGIISAGNIAGTFARDIKHAPNACAGAVAARRLDAAEAFAEEHGIDKAYQGYDALLRDADIDAVYVATPHTLHLPNSRDALRAGKAVLCEKPLVTSAAECRDLIGIALSSDAYLMEAMWTWFLPAIRRAKRWVDDGRIGALCQIRAELGFPKTYDSGSRLYNPSLAGGCLLDMGIYPIAIARLFSGRAPKIVHAAAREAPNGVEDDVAMLFDYGDCTASLACSFRCKLPNAIYLIGTDGHIVIPDGWSATECHLYGLENKVESFTDERRGSGFEFQITDVSDDLLNGRRQSRTVPHAASLAFQQDMDRVRASM